jgi:glycosyltransferase involved in cell wall biosynthesis
MISRPIRVLELRSVRGTGGGPEKTILLGSARTDPTRFAITVCYIRDDRDAVFSIDSKAAGLPVDYVELRERHSFDPSIWRQLRQLIHDRSIDIVHAHEYKTDLLAWLLSKVESITPMATAHGWTGHSWRERWLYYPIDKRLMAVFPRILSVSDDIRTELIRHGAKPQRVTTVLNGIDHQRFRRDRSREKTIRRQLGIGDDQMIVGAVGRLEPQKRFDLLIDALAELRTSHSQLTLVIVGDGSLRRTLSDQITRLGLPSSCLLLGQRADIIDLHHAFDVFVQSSDYEGTPNAVLEAMALETPVVATGVGGTAQLIRHGVDGLIVPPGNVAALGDAIRAMLSDRGAAEVFARSARQRIETDLSFDARMTAVEAIYTELFQHGRHTNQNTPLPART